MPNFRNLTVLVITSLTFTSLGHASEVSLQIPLACAGVDSKTEDPLTSSRDVHAREIFASLVKSMKPAMVGTYNNLPLWDKQIKELVISQKKLSAKDPKSNNSEIQPALRDIITERRGLEAQYKAGRQQLVNFLNKDGARAFKVIADKATKDDLANYTVEILNEENTLYGGPLNPGRIRISYDLDKFKLDNGDQEQQTRQIEFDGSGKIVRNAVVVSVGDVTADVGNADFNKLQTKDCQANSGWETIPTTVAREDDPGLPPLDRGSIVNYIFSTSPHSTSAGTGPAVKAGAGS